MKKREVSKKEMEAIHPYIPEAYGLLEQGRINRRQFLRTATLLGMSAGVAAIAAACGGTTEEEEEPAAAEEEPAAEAPAEEPVATGGIKRGGEMTIAMQLQGLDHPARLSWTQGANIVRQFGEYMTETGADNITRPYLVERWEASEDAGTWDLFLRQDVTWNNGDQFTADDVMFTFSEWLNPDVGSSMLGLLGYLGGFQNVEKVGDYQVRLHLDSPNFLVPEHLFHYPAIVLHRDFEGDIIQAPVGTGAFLLDEYAEGERAVFSRRPDYWRTGADGELLPYLDKITYVSIDKDAGVAALQSGQVDSMYDPRPSDFQALQGVDGLTTRPVSTSQCLVVRMRVDLEPWSDNRVRRALKMCQNRERILQLAYFGEGIQSIDAHVSPVHPSYVEKPIPEYDPEGAMALLQEYADENGLELPLQVSLTTKNDQLEGEVGLALKELALPGGFDITVNIVEESRYWESWTEYDLGVTSWTHRPQAEMLLPLAYTTEAIGNWNETRWADPEFEDLLYQAIGTLDLDGRRNLMSQMEDIMQERGPIGNSFWKNVWNITNSAFQGIISHPTQYDLFYEVWKDE